MKRYLWTGVTILCIGLEASDNPFDLKTNLKSLDEEQSSLISELRESSSSDEFFLNEEIDTGEEKIDSAEAPEHNTSLSQETPKAMLKDTSSKPSETKPSVEIPRKKSAEAIPSEKSEEMQTDAKKRESFKASESHETAMAEEQKKAEEARLKALEEERIAVEKYEAERLRKKQAEEAKQDTAPRETPMTPQKALKAETVPEQSLDIEKAMEQAKKKVEQSQIQKDTASTPTSQEEQSAPDAINLTPEEKEAKATADRLYREAIKEVDAE